MPQQTVVLYLSDEVFAIRHPILVTIEAQSTAILKIELASDRSAETWQAHCADLGAHRFHSIGMASDRGVGLTAGDRAACQEGFWVCDQFHAFQALFHRCHQSNDKPMELWVRRAKRLRHSRTPKARPIDKNA